ncbi:MAG: RNB domain-containing ribonuclease, partial [Promethearchaeota archaeon]
LSRGVGYFDAVGAKPRRWRPISLESYEAITAEMSRLRRLRERMIEVEEIEDEEGYSKSQNIPVALYILDLTKEEQTTLQRCQKWMEELVMNKEFKRNSEILGGTHIFSLGKFNLRNFLQFLAEDWTESRYLQPASVMTEFLLRTDYWNESVALENIAIRAVKENSNFTWDLDEEAQRQALEFPEPNEEKEEWKRRKDLRYLEAYTIDPATARDFDQALAYETHEDGSYSLFVMIADLTHYVSPGSYLDRHAKQRATSVYLPHRVLPMHPPALSTELCALQEKVPRFALTVQLDFSLEGERTGFKIYESIVQVKANLTYEYVDEKLSENDLYWTGMLDLGNKLRERF